MVPAFLDPNLKLKDLPYGVSFASAATGFDDYTANISVHAMPFYILCDIMLGEQHKQRLLNNTYVFSK